MCPCPHFATSWSISSTARNRCGSIMSLMASGISGCLSGPRGNGISLGRCLERAFADAFLNLVVIDTRLKKERAHLHAILVNRHDEIAVDRILGRNGAPDVSPVTLKSF
jgi:hypothetical protein